MTCAITFEYLIPCSQAITGNRVLTKADTGAVNRKRTVEHKWAYHIVYCWYSAGYKDISSLNFQLTSKSFLKLIGTDSITGTVHSHTCMIRTPRFLITSENSFLPVSLCCKDSFLRNRRRVSVIFLYLFMLSLF